MYAFYGKLGSHTKRRGVLYPCNRSREMYSTPTTFSLGNILKCVFEITIKVFLGSK